MRGNCMRIFLLLLEKQKTWGKEGLLYFLIHVGS